MAVALIVAAGSGERLGASRPKAFVLLGGRPMLAWSVQALRAVERVEQIVVALPPGEAAPEGTVGVAGGASRSESVRAALEAAGEGDPVIVHDAARPLADTALFDRALDELESTGADAVVAAAPVSDTIKRADEGGRVLETPDRAGLWAVQTPQVFRRAALEEALADEVALASATDDASLVEAHGGDVRVLEAPAENLKVTTPLDLRVAELLLADRLDGRADVALIREMLRRFDDRDNTGSLALVHPEVVLDTTGFRDMALVAGIYHGHEGMLRYWSEWLAEWKDLRFEYLRFEAGDHGVLVRTVQSTVGRASGAQVHTTHWNVYEVQDGLMKRMRVFSDEAEAREAAGLR